FFQAEDGIRGRNVTGVQTCALPILAGSVAALIAASTMYCGVGKSGSPAPNPITGRPAAFIALALASTASVADSAMPETRRDTRRSEERRVGKGGRQGGSRRECRDGT